MENVSHKNFLLNGFSELEGLRPFLFIPFFLMFGLSLSANSLLLYVVVVERSLHSPMHLLISSMACVDMSLLMFFVPNMLLNFLFDWKGISLMGCLVQMHFLHFVGTFQSTVLVWMALDRYFAICTPLYYHSSMSLPTFLKFVVPLVVRNLLLITLIVSLAGRLSFCASNVINHCFCEHMALVELACGNTAVNNLVGLLTISFTIVVDFIFIAASYVVIFFCVLSSGRSSIKALHTCVTHIVVMSITMILALTVFLSYRISNHLPAASRVLFSNMYLLFPSCLNPIIYGIRTKEIRKQIVKVGDAALEEKMNISSHRHFILNGFDELQTLRPVLFLPYSLMFILSLSANSLLLYVVVSQRSLHSPMYVLIAGMAFVDLSLPLVFVPNMLLSFLLDWRGISLSGCLFQMYFIHFVGAFQSTLLVWMALDRYFAICRPLYYNECMALPTFLKFVVPFLVRNVFIVMVVVILAGRLTFCSGNVIEGCFCEHMALVELACGSTAINSLVGLVSVFLVVVVDFLFTITSYVIIFSSVLSSGIWSSKALHTCITHIVVISMSLIIVLTAFLSFRIRNGVVASVRVFFSTMYPLFPSCFNPIIYGIRTTEIRQQILKILTCHSVKPVPRSSETNKNV